MPELLLSFPSGLAATIAIEVAVVALLLWIRHFYLIGKNSDHPEPFLAESISPLMLVVGLNLASYPVAWWAWNFQGVSYWLVEISVVIFEAALLWIGLRGSGQRETSNQAFTWQQALLMSLVLNLASGSIGWLI